MEKGWARSSGWHPPASKDRVVSNCVAWTLGDGDLRAPPPHPMFRAQPHLQAFAQALPSA